MIEFKVLLYVAGEPRKIAVTVREPDGHDALNGFPYHLAMEGFFDGVAPWGKALFNWWGFVSLPEEERRLASLGHPCEVLGEPADWKAMSRESGGQELWGAPGWWVAECAERSCVVERRGR